MIPKSKVLSVQKGVMANAKVNYGSSKQSQSVTVNIQGNSEVKNDDIEVKYGDTKPTDDPNPYAHLSLPPDVNTMLQEKDRYLEALNIIIHIIKSNPLIVNKFVIAEYQLESPD